MPKEITNDEIAKLLKATIEHLDLNGPVQVLLDARIWDTFIAVHEDGLQYSFQRDEIMLNRNPYRFIELIESRYKRAAATFVRMDSTPTLVSLKRLTEMHLDGIFEEAGRIGGEIDFGASLRDAGDPPGNVKAFLQDLASKLGVQMDEMVVLVEKDPCRPAFKVASARKPLATISKPGGEYTQAQMAIAERRVNDVMKAVGL